MSDQNDAKSMGSSQKQSNKSEDKVSSDKALKREKQLRKVLKQALSKE